MGNKIVIRHKRTGQYVKSFVFGMNYVDMDYQKKEGPPTLFEDYQIEPLRNSPHWGMLTKHFTFNEWVRPS